MAFFERRQYDKADRVRVRRFTPLAVIRSDSGNVAPKVNQFISKERRE
jgi:hypothetical protein